MSAITTTGTVAARPQERARRSKLDLREAFMRTLIDAKENITFEEMRARFLAEHNLTVGLGTCGASPTHAIPAAFQKKLTYLELYKIGFSEGEIPEHDH